MKSTGGRELSGHRLKVVRTYLAAIGLSDLLWEIAPVARSVMGRHSFAGILIPRRYAGGRMSILFLSRRGDGVLELRDDCHLPVGVFALRSAR